MKINMVDLEAQFESIGEEMTEAVADVLKGSQYILGPKVLELEGKIATYCRTERAVGVASGTDALHLALEALGIGRGDEVITTPFTFFATAEAIMYTGAKPVFVDIEPDTFNMDASQIEGKINKNTRAILPVHMFGQVADMNSIMPIAREHGLAVVEDCAQAIGAQADGVMAGAFGSAGCFSFYPSKNLGACGDGGMITVNDEVMVDTLIRLRNHGFSGSYVHNRIGFNSRLDEVQAAILLVKFRHIETYNEMRRKNAALYTELLGENFSCPVVRPGNTHVYHQYTIKSPRRDEIKQGLAEADIASNIYYPVPLHMQEALAELGYKEGDFEVAESVSREVLSLPMYPELDAQKIRLVAKTALSI